MVCLSLLQSASGAFGVSGGNYRRLPPPVVFGLIGKMGSGKSTAAQAIKEEAERLGHIVAIIPMAKKLKEIAKMLGWNGQKDEKGRKLLQLLGTDVLRECISENYHIDAWKECANEVISTGTDVLICDDLRFDNEVDFLVHEYDAVIVQIVRPGLPEQSGHKSERGIDSRFLGDKFCRIENEGAVEEMILRVKDVVKSFVN